MLKISNLNHNLYLNFQQCLEEKQLQEHNKEIKILHLNIKKFVVSPTPTQS